MIDSLQLEIPYARTNKKQHVPKPIMTKNIRFFLLAFCPGPSHGGRLTMIPHAASLVPTLRCNCYDEYLLKHFFYV